MFLPQFDFPPPFHFPCRLFLWRAFFPLNLNGFASFLSPQSSPSGTSPLFFSTVVLQPSPAVATGYSLFSFSDGFPLGSLPNLSDFSALFPAPSYFPPPPSWVLVFFFGSPLVVFPPRLDFGLIFFLFFFYFFFFLNSFKTAPTFFSLSFPPPPWFLAKLPLPAVFLFFPPFVLF